MFDGVTYAFEPGEVRLLPDTDTNPVAKFLSECSAVQVEFESNVGERVFVRQGDPKWNLPINTGEFVELVDRSFGDNPIGVGTGGIQTHAAVIPVRGGKRLTRAAIPS
jgi:hypothetical protein